jgi:hypothetical protein
MTTTTAPRTVTASRTTAGSDIALGLGVLGVLCLALIPVEIHKAFGLPAHPLLLHVPVILVPLLALALLAAAASPAFFERHALGIGALTVASLASTILTVGAGEALRADRPVHGAEVQQLAEHADSAETLRIVVIVLAAVVLFAVALTKAERGSRLARLSVLADDPRVWIALRALFVIGAVVAGFFVIRTGHVGAKLTWAEG